MPRQELITTDIINQIESWVDAGLSPKAIAEKIGCTLGALKVRCAQLRISLRRTRLCGAPAFSTSKIFRTPLFKSNVAKAGRR